MIADLTFSTGMIGHSKITTQTVHDIYRNRNDGIEVLLKYRDQPIGMDGIIKPFMMAPNEDLVLFTASLPDQQTTPDPLATVPDVLRTPPRANSFQCQAESSQPQVPASPLPTCVKKEPGNDDGADLFPQRACSDLFGEASVPTTSVPEHHLATPAHSHGPGVTRPSIPEHHIYNANVQQFHAFAASERNSTMPPFHHGSEINGFQPFAAPPAQTASASTVNNEFPSFQEQIAVKDEMTPDSVPPPHLDAEEQMPFDPDTFFHRGSSPAQPSQEEVTSSTADQSIRRIIEYQDPHVLEAGVAKSMIVLQELKQTFVRHSGHPDAVAWTEAINKLIPQAQRKRTIVGVVGNTGAGKSSVINAMLDEERLVPTNCKLLMYEVHI